MTHYSPTDPEARIAVKPGKPRQLCYLASIAVDAAEGIITHIQADLAGKKDSVCLQSLVENTRSRLARHDLKLRRIAADAGYSSGENYAWPEQEKITGFIPVHGLFQKQREGFVYDQLKDSFTCPQGKLLTMTRHFVDREYYWKKSYRASRKDCNTCPVREACPGKKAREKKLDMTCFHTHCHRAYSRQTSKKGEYMKKLRQSRAEPVLGTLISFLALRRINTRGQASAHKVMLLSAMAFNLRKLLRWNRKTDLAAARALTGPLPLLFPLFSCPFSLR